MPLTLTSLCSENQGHDTNRRIIRKHSKYTVNPENILVQKYFTVAGKKTEKREQKPLLPRPVSIYSRKKN